MLNTEGVKRNHHCDYCAADGRPRGDTRAEITACDYHHQLILRLESHKVPPPTEEEKKVVFTLEEHPDYTDPLLSKSIP